MTFKKYTAHKMLALDQAPYWKEKEKKLGVGGKKNGERREPRGSLGRGKDGEAWRHTFDAADPPSRN